MKKYLIIGTILLAVAAGGSYYWLRATTPSYTTVAVERKPIIQQVSANGNVAAPTTISLRFQAAGQLVAVNAVVGSKVTAGEALAREDTSVLAAQLRQAQAAVDTQAANLAILESGTRPEQLALYQSAVTQAKQALRNTLQTAYATADDAVHNKADQLFTNPRTSGAALVFDVPDSQLQNRVEQERIALEPVLAAWQAQLTDPSFATTDPSGAATAAEARLNQISVFLNDANQAVAKTSPSAQFSSAQLSAYATAVSAGRLAVAASLSAITTDSTALTSAEGTLTLANAGSTADAIQAQQAQVDQAQANKAIIEAQIAQARLVAPAAGTVTEVNGNVGETVSPADVVVSILPASKLQVDVNLSEDNVAHVVVGNAVQVALDAFPGTTWPGTVVKMDPAQTIIGGAVYYHTTVALDAPDSRIKTGMTANVLIETGSATSTLVVPASALQVTGTSTSVHVMKDGAPVNQPVTTGLKSQDGMVEILSGLSEGQRVVTGS